MDGIFAMPMPMASAILVLTGIALIFIVKMFALILVPAYSKRQIRTAQQQTERNQRVSDSRATGQRMDCNTASY